MKRALLLMIMIVLVAWLAGTSSANDKRESALASAAAPSLNAAAPNAPLQGSCCSNPGDTNPHWECFDGTCSQVYSCGPNVDCATCACSSSDEWNCINNGGYWDPYSCYCDYSCDPTGSQQQSCLAQEGYWDPDSCTCSFYGCDPTGSEEQSCINQGRHWDPDTCTCGFATVCACDEEELVGQDSYDYDYCDGYYYQYCTITYYDYYQDCDSPCGPRYRTEEVTSCYSYYEYCGDGGGGGGGGGDCWDTGDCWCDDWWGVCCEYDYCYEEFEE